MPSNAEQDKLRKTSAEQAILLNIQQLESELAEAKGERKATLLKQLQLMKEELAKISGPNYIFLEEENEKLKKELSDLKEKMDALNRECGLLKKASGFAALKEEAENISPDERRLQFNLYKFLLQKYSSLINDSENKTVGEIKSLINAEDLTIQSIVEGIKSEKFVFEKDFLDTAKKLYNFVVGRVQFVDPSLGLNFWLNPKELMELQLGGSEDLSTFLCSLLAAVGDEKAEVVIAELENSSTHAFVITEFNSLFVLLDPAQKKPFLEFVGNKKEVLKKYSFNGSKIKKFVYRFNKNSYEQFV